MPFGRVAAPRLRLLLRSLLGSLLAVALRLLAWVTPWRCAAVLLFGDALLLGFSVLPVCCNSEFFGNLWSASLGSSLGSCFCRLLNAAFGHSLVFFSNLCFLLLSHNLLTILPASKLSISLSSLSIPSVLPVLVCDEGRRVERG